MTELNFIKRKGDKMSHPWDGWEGAQYGPEQAIDGYWNPQCKNCKLHFHNEFYDGHQVPEGIQFVGCHPYNRDSGDGSLGRNYSYTITESQHKKLEDGIISNLCCPKCGQTLTSFMVGE